MSANSQKPHWLLTSRCPALLLRRPGPGPPVGPLYSHTRLTVQPAAGGGTPPKEQVGVGAHWQSTGRTRGMRGPAGWQSLQGGRDRQTDSSNGGAMEDWQARGTDKHCSCGKQKQAVCVTCLLSGRIQLRSANAMHYNCILACILKGLHGAAAGSCKLG